MASQKWDKASIKVFLSGLTHQPGVYQMLDASGLVLYVGKARDLKNRISSYFSSQKKDIKTVKLIQHVVDIHVTVTHDENAALLLECNLIKRHRPHYNVLFRDDKSYPFIYLTAHRYPQITLYRGRKKKPDGQLFGPYVDSSAVRDTIHLIEKIFQIRNCSDSFFSARKRPCIQHQIGRCSAPCTGLISETAYQSEVQHAVLFLKGKNTKVIEKLQIEMESAAHDLDFERAAMCRDQVAYLRDIQAKQYVSGVSVSADVLGFAEQAGMVCIQMLVIRQGRMSGSRAFFPEVPFASRPEEILAAFISQRYLDADFLAEDIPQVFVLSKEVPEFKSVLSALKDKSGHAVKWSRGLRGQRKKWLEMAENSARQSIATSLFARNNWQMRLQALAECFDFPQPPQRIECIDISHTLGESTVGSWVVFGAEGPLKSLYRCFNITGVKAGDDLAAMKELLQRRFANTFLGAEASLPDVLLVDGGAPQLHAVRCTLAELGLNTLFVVGVAKGVTRKAGFEVLHLPDRSPLHLPSDSPALHLIQQVRDEAHRFAITGHRSRRDRKRTRSVLETIPGVGRLRRRELLRHFGGLQAINRASLEALSQVPGISLALAERIYEVLHRTSS